MLKRLIAWLTIHTEAEAYADGRCVAETAMQNADNKQDMVDVLYYHAGKSISKTAIQDAFDLGVIDRLKELGYEPTETKNGFL
jgi:hypothetical protein